jgi:hypothetical protein
MALSPRFSHSISHAWTLMLVGMLVLGACAHPAPPIDSISDKSYRAANYDPYIIETIFSFKINILKLK